jgi:hydroxyacylglutathione hydrolase
MREVEELRAANASTIPSTIGLEKRTNPFLRPNASEIRRTLNMPDATDVEVFAEMRARKDAF